jgi:hypothetical protein
MNTRNLLMNEPYPEHLEEQIRETAAGFRYPPTPDIAGAVQGRLAKPRQDLRANRRLATAMVTALVLCLLATMLAVTAVPPARAALLRILQIGAVRINLFEETLPAAQEPPGPFSILDLGQEISLDEARELVAMPDPPFPPALGQPDAIYGQNLIYREPVVSFFWQSAEERPQILVTLIAIPQMGLKWAAGEQYTAADVAGQPAAWIEGPHLFDLDRGQIDQAARVATNVLIWSDGDVTYRLEGDLTLAEALQIAGSWK